MAIFPTTIPKYYKKQICTIDLFTNNYLGAAFKGPSTKFAVNPDVVWADRWSGAAKNRKSCNFLHRSSLSQSHAFFVLSI